MVYEIYGPSDSGKSVYVLDRLESDNNTCLYVNADFQLMDNIVSDNVYIVNDNNIEIIKDIIENLRDSLDIVVIDSLPMITNSDHNLSRVISDIQKIISICNRNKIDLYIINQYRTNEKCTDYTYYLNRLRLYYNKRIKVG